MHNDNYHDTWRNTSPRSSKDHLRQYYVCNDQPRTKIQLGVIYVIQLRKSTRTTFCNTHINMILPHRIEDPNTVILVFIRFKCQRNGQVLYVSAISPKPAEQQECLIFRSTIKTTRRVSKYEEGERKLKKKCGHKHATETAE